MPWILQLSYTCTGSPAAPTGAQALGEGGSPWKKALEIAGYT